MACSKKRATEDRSKRRSGESSRACQARSRSSGHSIVGGSVALCSAAAMSLRRGAKLEHSVTRGRQPARVANPALRAARVRRGWTEDDAAVALAALRAGLGEPEPALSGAQFSKWERGVRNPGRFYRPRLCLLFEAEPQEIGLVPSPRLMHDVGELGRRRVERHRSPVRREPEAEPLADVAEGDAERLRATLRHLWPVDGPLLAGLARASAHLAERRDTEPPSSVMPPHRRLLDLLIELLSRPQRSGTARELARIAAFVGQNLAMAEWVTGNAAATHRTYAIAESLARDSRSGAQLGLILVDRSEMAAQVARQTGEWEDAVVLADAAEAAAIMDPSTPAGVWCWIHGERGVQRAMLGDDWGSGFDLERMEEVRASADPGSLNVFSGGVDVGSGWVDCYRVRRLLSLGQAEEAAEDCERILRSTDPRLVWQFGETLTLVAEARAAQGELSAAAQRLGEAADLLGATENERDLLVVRRLLG